MALREPWTRPVRVAGDGEAAGYPCSTRVAFATWLIVLCLSSVSSPGAAANPGSTAPSPSGAPASPEPAIDQLELPPIRAPDAQAANSSVPSAGQPAGAPSNATAAVAPARPQLTAPAPILESLPPPPAPISEPAPAPAPTPVPAPAPIVADEGTTSTAVEPSAEQDAKSLPPPTPALPPPDPYIAAPIPSPPFPSPSPRTPAPSPPSPEAQAQEGNEPVTVTLRGNQGGGKGLSASTSNVVPWTLTAIVITLAMGGLGFFVLRKYALRKRRLADGWTPYDTELCDLRTRL